MSSYRCYASGRRIAPACRHRCVHHRYPLDVRHRGRGGKDLPLLMAAMLRHGLLMPLRIPGNLCRFHRGRQDDRHDRGRGADDPRQHPAEDARGRLHLLDDHIGPHHRRVRKLLRRLIWIQDALGIMDDTPIVKRAFGSASLFLATASPP